MARSSSLKHRSLLTQKVPEIKKNAPLQVVLFSLFLLMLFVYGFLMTYQLSAVLYAVDSNTKMISSDTKLEEVADFEVANNSVVINLFNGKTVNRQEVEFAFYENTGADETFYSAETNTLLMELEDNYATTFLLGSNYFVVLIASLISTLLLFVIRKKEWVVLSKRVTRVLSCAVFLGLSFVGLCFYATL